jgi:hypothetical protein
VAGKGEWLMGRANQVHHMNRVAGNFLFVKLPVVVSVN